MSNTDRSPDQVYRLEIYPALVELYSAALKMTGSSADAEDLIQATALIAWQNRERYSAERRPHAWLRTVMRNAWISDRRREAVRKRAEPAVTYLTEAIADAQRELTDARVTAFEARRGAADLLGHLGAVKRPVVRLVDVEGLSYREAADRLGIPIGTVMSRLHRGRAELRRAVAS